MSTDYYAVCKKHNIGAHITNNKGDKPLSRAALREFLILHSGCSPVLEDEHIFDLSLCIEDKDEPSEIAPIKKVDNMGREVFRAHVITFGLSCFALGVIVGYGLTIWKP